MITEDSKKQKLKKIGYCVKSIPSIS